MILYTGQTCNGGSCHFRRNSNQLSISQGGARVERWCWVNFRCRGVLLIWIIVGQGPTALAVGAGGGCLAIFSLIYHFSLLSPSLWETARYRLKYCLKGPLSPTQPTNQPNRYLKVEVPSKQLISQSKFSGPRKFTLRYQKFELKDRKIIQTSFFYLRRYFEISVFGISRADCMCTYQPPLRTSDVAGEETIF